MKLNGLGISLKLNFLHKQCRIFSSFSKNRRETKIQKTNVSFSFSKGSQNVNHYFCHLETVKSLAIINVSWW